ncbi:MAG: DUF1697 domain-containing protein [Bacteroidota bacterium]|nr:DUF1697 domain-containing protein [Bacteroidota bacterium]
MPKKEAKLSRYVALLRGINVGGKHKVAMKDLVALLQHLGYTEIKTILNSGNVIFSAPTMAEPKLAAEMEQALSTSFHFSIPVIVLSLEAIQNLMAVNPFSEIEPTKDTRFYVSFLKERSKANLDLPYVSVDGSFQILGIHDKIILSFLDVSKAKTPQVMDIIEKTYGKEITTRNWNTLLKIAT